MTRFEQRLTYCCTSGDHVPRKGLAIKFLIHSKFITNIQGTATREDIDTTLKLGMNHPMGPLQLGTTSLSVY